jgi:hypothetical protein
MADAKAAGDTPVPTDTPEYGCIDLAALQAATAEKPEAKTGKASDATDKE